MRLIDADKLVEEFNNKGIHIEFDLPVEEILGEDVDLDDFTMLMQDGIMAYKKMVIDTISKQPTAYDVDKVVEHDREVYNNAIDDVLQELDSMEFQGGTKATLVCAIATKNYIRSKVEQLKEEVEE